MQRVILVTGATGHVGRHVVSQLLGADAAVRALVRNPDSVGLPGRVEVMRGDLSVPNTLDSCLYGVEAVFLVWPGLPIDFASAVLDAVRKHARRIVYLSSLSVRDDLQQQADPMTTFHAAIERLIGAALPTQGEISGFDYKPDFSQPERNRGADRKTQSTLDWLSRRYPSQSTSSGTAAASSPARRRSRR